MQRLIPLLILAMCLSSCGIFKSSIKRKSLDKSKTEVSYKSDSTDLTVDKSRVVINERIDTTVTTKRRTFTQSGAAPLSTDSLYSGMTSMVNDLLTVTLKLDSVTGILNTTVTLQPESFPVRFDKTTTEQRDITKSVVTGKTIQYADEQEQASEVKDKQPAKMGIWLIFAGCLVVCGVAWYVNRKLFK